VYQEQLARMRDYKISFETFLLAPAEILEAMDRPPIIVVRAGLLPRQRRTQQRIDLETALDEMTARAIDALDKEAHCANGVWVGKMKHHRLPNRPKRFRALVEMN
jgi:hypothetical protein